MELFVLVVYCYCTKLVIPFSFWKKIIFREDEKIIHNQYFPISPFYHSHFLKTRLGSIDGEERLLALSACIEDVRVILHVSSRILKEFTYSRKIILKSTCFGAYFRASISNCLKMFKLFSQDWNPKPLPNDIALDLLELSLFLFS